MGSFSPPTTPRSPYTSRPSPYPAAMPRVRLSRATLFLGLLLTLAFAFFFLAGEKQGEADPYAHIDLSDAGFAKHHARPKPAGHGWLDYFASDTGEGELQYGADGLVRGWDRAHALVRSGAKGLGRREKKRVEEVQKTHPIVELMAKGKERWEALLARQSKTLPQAVMEYTRRYGRAPPKGFEEWWQFCKRNNVKIVDDYDQIFRDTNPYHGISGADFRKRADALWETKFTYAILLSPNGTTALLGERADASRPQSLHGMLAPLAPYLPAEITIHGSDHDLGSWLLGHDQLLALETAIKEGRYMSEEELKPYQVRQKRVAVDGLVSCCPEGSLAWNQSLAIKQGETIPEVPIETTFMYDPSSTFDFCLNPSLLKLHGSLSWDFARETELRPIMQLSKFARNPEFLTTPLQAYTNLTADTLRKYHSDWDQKDLNKLFWRGSATGDSYSKRGNYDWHNGHRIRLSLMASAQTGNREVWVERGREWEREQWGVKRLNERYMDVGFTGKPHQCRQEDGTCDQMATELEWKGRISPEEALKYKYVLDVDGNGWSSRFHRLIISGSAVIKSTIYPEWHTDWLTPWVHYIPSQVDYSDLYSILSFFIGSPDARSEGHDDLGRQIAANALDFAKNHWRWEDMQAYMFRLLLEYARLQADDREAFSYQKTYGSI